MSSVFKAPLMKIRQHLHDPRTSFATTETISATKYALREYMRSHPNGQPFTEQELDLVKFRHRSVANQTADVLEDVKNPWSGNWSISYVREEDRLQGDAIASQHHRKAFYKYTLFGYCELLPVA